MKSYEEEVSFVDMVCSVAIKVLNTKGEFGRNTHMKGEFSSSFALFSYQR